MAFIPEFEAVIEDPKSSFIATFFTEHERTQMAQKQSSEKGIFLAGRYAAKEAFIKALDGDRLFQPAAFQPNYADIEIRNDPYGRPFIKAYNEVAKSLSDLSIRKARVSISHIKDYAVSQVLLEL